MSATTVVTVLASVGLPAALVALLRRGTAGNRAWADTIADHVAATGDHPTVAQWRAGHLHRPLPEPGPVPDGPVTITVTVIDAEPAELTGGAR